MIESIILFGIPFKLEILMELKGTNNKYEEEKDQNMYFLLI